MARLALNKSSLHREAQELKSYRRFLPSLELKRQQLTVERAKARAEIARMDKELDALRRWVEAKLPMLANQQIELESLVRVDGVKVGEENLVGVVLPVLRGMEIEIRPYSFMVKPHWVDKALEKFKTALELQLHRRLAVERDGLLDVAVRKVTQRVNLFEKVLIPRAEENIRTIKIFLSDQERAAVVRAKLAKAKRAAERLI